MKISNKLSRRSFFMKSGTLMAGAVFSKPLLSLIPGTGCSPAGLNIRYVMVAGEKVRFMAWPANNGLWKWDDGREILVGHTDGTWEEQSGHNISGTEHSRLARSVDGGRTWVREFPVNFVGSNSEPVPSPGNIRFGHPDFALRVASMGYHGTNDPLGRFFISYDRGRTWQGSYRFNKLNDEPELQGMAFTARTSYLVTGERSAMIMMTARKPDIEFASRLDKPFVAETNDGGTTFRFVSWAVPWTDQYRAVMPTTVRTDDGKIIFVARRRNPRDNDQQCWLDSFVSKDNGRSWSFLSRVGDTGLHNGNPAGLALLRDGRLACCYGNRDLRQVLVRFSNNDGGSWGDPVVIRENPLNYDIGYPQLLQNDQGEMVAIYYLATEENPFSHIEAAIWKP